MPFKVVYSIFSIFINLFVKQWLQLLILLFISHKRLGNQQQTSCVCVNGHQIQDMRFSLIYHSHTVSLKLKYNCFTVLCQFLLYNKNQLYVCNIPSLLSLLPTPTIPPLQVITEHRAELPVLYIQHFQLAVCFMHGSIYMSVLLSQFIPPSPSPPVSTVHSLCLCLYSCPTNIFISSIFLESIYMH